MVIRSLVSKSNFMGLELKVYQNTIERVVSQYQYLGTIMNEA